MLSLRSRFSHFRSAVRLAGIVGLVVACGGIDSALGPTASAPGERLLNAIITPDSIGLLRGRAMRLALQVTAPDGRPVTDRPVSWRSSDTTIAVVSSDGTVTARAAGSARVTADVAGTTALASVTVAEPPPPALVSDLTVTGQTDSSLAVRFTEVQDGLGGVSSYLIYAATADSLLLAAAPVTAGTCRGLVRGTAVGAALSCTVAGLQASTRYVLQAVAVRGVLGAGEVYGARSSPISGTTAEAQIGSIALTPATVLVFPGDSLAFAATVRDTRGNVLTGRTLVWSTDASSVASVSQQGRGLALATGSARIRATAGGVSGSSTVTVALPSVARLLVATQPSGGEVGQALSIQPVVRLVDAAGRVVPVGDSVVATVATGRGTILGTARVQAVNGVAAFSAIGIAGDSGWHSLRFASGTLSVTSDSFRVQLVPVATALRLATQPGSASSGTALTPQPVVQVVDQFGRDIASSVTVTASIASGAGALSGGTSVQAVGGVATFTGLSIAGTGTHTIRFTATGLSAVTSTSVNITAPVPSAVALQVATQPGGAVTGAAMTTQPVIHVVDQAGSRVASAVSVTAAVESGTGTLSGTATATAVNGIATFTNLRITGSGSHRLRFSATALTPAISNAFDVTNPVTRLRVVPDSVRLRPDSVQVFTVQATRADGTAGTTSVTWSAVGGTIGTDGRFVAGRSPGRFIVTATAGGTALVDSSIVQVEVVPASCAISPVGATVQAGRSTPFTVRVTMNNGTVSAPPVTWTATGGTVDSTGLYVAGGTVGVYRIAAAVIGTTVACSQDVSVTPSVAVPPDATVFSSNWSTATGQSRQAISDGGKWAEVQWWTEGDVRDGSVVSASGLSFPAGVSNVLRTPYATSGDSFNAGGNVLVSPSDNRYPIPAVGQTFFLRFYFRNALRNSVSGSAAAHPVQGYGTATGSGWNNTNCSRHWWMKVGSVGNARPNKMGFGWEFNASPSNGGRTGPFQFYIEETSTGGELNKFQTYLVELALTRTSEFLWTVNTRIDGQSANDRFVGYDAAGRRVTLAGNNTNIAIAPNCVGTLFVGNNDPGSSLVGADHLQDFMYYGAVAVAVRADPGAWIGAFQATRGY